MAGPTVCQKRWSETLTSFESNHNELIAEHPDWNKETGLIRNALITIRQLIHNSPSVNGNGTVRKELVARAEAERTVLCKHLDGKALFTGIL
jgi:hypothetical protein